MTWREAFLRQARSDAQVWQLLNRERQPYAHQLHYLQMSAEKLAKAVMTSPTATAAPMATHAALVPCLQAIKGRPEIRRARGYSQAKPFREYIDSLLPLAREIERLAPNFAGRRSRTRSIRGSRRARPR